MLKQVSEAFRD